MISDIENFQASPTSSAGQPIIATRHEARASELAVTPASSAQPSTFNHQLPVQPIADVPAYLATRTPQPTLVGEEALFITLPAVVQREVRALVRACELVRDFVNRKTHAVSVQAACRLAVQTYAQWNWHLKTFRAKYDCWVHGKDWVLLVNRAKAGKAWGQREFGLSNEFLDFVAARCGEFKRSDALPAAIRSIHRQWQTGRNERGEAQVVPSYESNWSSRNKEIIPVGWTIGNLRTQLKRRAKYLKVHKALLHEGIATARAFIPQVRSTREGLRFMEEVQFDDVKCDFRVFDTLTGKPVDLWLLIAHDRATGMLLGFGLRPAAVREDGTQEHLKLRDMKQLCGWLLERYGLPPYPMTWKVEHGTATLSEGTAAALRELLPERVGVSFSMMIGGRSASGYLERALGNSKGKASLESHNRQMHLIGASLPGQTGPHYGVRPKDLAAREKECITIWNAAQEFPAGVRERLTAEFGYPLLTLPQARKELVRIFGIRNSRTDHNMEGFEPILVNAGGRILKRMQSPQERAAQLCEGIKFDRVSPEVITAFYEHTQRTVTVTDAGEIEFTHEARKLTFADPSGAHGVTRPTTAPGTKLLAYFHPDDPRFLHLTDGKGAIVGTWLRRALVKHGDTEALSEAMRHSASALNAAKGRAAQLNAGETARLDAMRERNNQLLGSESFIDVAEAGNCVTATRVEFTSPVAAALAGTVADQRASKKAAAKHAKDLREFDGDVGELVGESEITNPKSDADEFSAEGLL